MKLLLDTHTFLWHSSGDQKLSTSAKGRIQDPENEVFVSVISFWEAIIKHANGKLPLPGPPEKYLIDLREKHQFSALPLDEKSLRHLPQLPAHHRDPFDRILICQALEYDLTIVTADEAIIKYSVPVLW